MSGRRKPARRVLFNFWTREEATAAVARQDAGFPHPEITDAAWAKIQARWATLPMEWGRGPWLDRDKHQVRVRTSGGPMVYLFRVDTKAWGVLVEETKANAGNHRGTLDELIELVIAAWPPAPTQPSVAQQMYEAHLAKKQKQEDAKKAMTHQGVREALDWIEEPTLGFVSFAAFDRFKGGPCEVSWGGADLGERMTAAQMRAARALIDRGEAILGALLDGLFRDQRRNAEDDDFPKARGPTEILKHVDLLRIDISRDERGGMAFTDFAFSDAWRSEHGLQASMHGTRLAGVGGYGGVHRHGSASSDADDGGDGGPTRTADGALVAERWVKQPYDGVVALPMWEGLPGRWKVSFVYEDDGELELTSGQVDAASRLVDEGDAIRDALLAALFASYEKSKDPPRPIDEPAGLTAVIAPIALRVHAEDLDGLAYTELSVRAPWRKSGKATVVMHGARAVALTTKAGVEDAIMDDQDARLRAARAAKRAKKRPSAKAGSAPSKKARVKKKVTKA